MKRLGLIVIACSVQLAAASPLDEARHALADGLTKVALAKAKAAVAAGDEAARPVLAESLLRSGDGTAALEVLAQVKGSELLRGRSFLALGEWEKALVAFARTESESSTLAALGRAQALIGLGRGGDAENLLETLREDAGVGEHAALLLASLQVSRDDHGAAWQILERLDPKDATSAKWKRLLEGQILLARGRLERAEDAFDNVRKPPEGMTMELAAGATMGLARVAMERGKLDDAADELEHFLKEHPETKLAGPLFALLHRVYSQQRDPELKQLKKWARRGRDVRTLLACYYLALEQERRGETDEALELVDRFLEDPLGDMASDAFELKARLLTESGRTDEALAAFDEAAKAARSSRQVARVELLAGGLEFRERAHAEAAARFRNAADLAEGDLKETAIFNAALASLNSQDDAGFLESYAQMSALFPESSLRRELVLEEGLIEARAGDGRARDTLLRFVKDFPENHRVPEANLVLAEQAWLAPDRDVATARQFLRVANESPDDSTRERAAALAIFMDAENGSSDAVIDAANEFIREHGNSPLLPDVRMKLAEVYFKSGDYGNARTQLEIVGTKFPDSPYADAALFLAGQAAARSMNTDRALEIFEEVARSGSPLKLNARQEQAALKSRLGDEEDAVKLYDAVLAEEPEPELKFAAMAGKGMSLTTLGETTPARLEEAVAIFDKLASLPEVTPHWRNLALYRKGRALQAMGNDVAALTVFYDALDRSAGPEENAETFWLYKSGSEAARMLERRDEWKAAAAIYKKLLQIKGPRTAEIQERLRMLRLEHFIWD